MKFFGYEIKKAAPTTSMGTVLDSRQLLGWIGGADGYINTSTVTGQAVAYAKCSVLASVINKKVAAIGNAAFWAKDMQGNDLERTAELEQAMTPNPWQSLNEFVCMCEFFCQIFGKAYIVKVRPVGFSEVELYVIPNTMIEENYYTSHAADNVFAPMSDVKDYTVSLFDGARMIIPKEDVFVVTDSSFELNKMGDSTSRMVSLEYPINTFVSAYQAGNELLVNRGMLSIISLQSDDPMTDLATPATKNDRKVLEERLNSYGILRGRAKYAITAFKAANVPVSSTIEDLGLADIQMSCKRDIAYTYQVPSVLLDIEGSTFSNMAEAKLELYTGDIIPSANNIMRTINKAFGFENVQIVATFDHLELFQESKRKQTAGMLSLIDGIIKAVESGLMTIEEGKNELNKYIV